MINRRQIMLGLVSAAALAVEQVPLAAATALGGKLEWNEFVVRLKELSNRFTTGRIGQKDMEHQGLALISRLNIDAASFDEAVANAYESGNLFWLWQRLTKSPRLDGGILNIDQTNMIPLHDHPNATGMVRVISGETEVWKFERLGDDVHKPGEAELKLIFHGILRPGDTASVTPQNGNIHALRSLSNECRMLDFFIPPFDRPSLLYFEPDDPNWFDKQQISCRTIPRNKFTRS